MPPYRHNTMQTDTEIAVIGGGVVGSAIAYGLARAGIRVVLIDGARGDARAALANFGLVWVQGKGSGLPPYQALTRTASDAWGAFAAELEQTTGVDVVHSRPGGLTFCLGEAEFEARARKLKGLHNESGGAGDDCTMLDRPALQGLLPDLTLGDDVTGASFCWRDGHANPLALLHALQAAVVRLGGRILRDAPVEAVRPTALGYEVRTARQVIGAGRVVLAAGLGTRRLAEPLGLSIPVVPERGQVLVTERRPAFLPYPASGLRQTAEGTVMIGAINEDVGYDTHTTPAAAARLAGRATRIAPALRSARLVRQWAGLRVMTPDSYPIYQQSAAHPGVVAAVCHSGITLAPVHATALARAIADDTVGRDFEAFRSARFAPSDAAAAAGH